MTKAVVARQFGDDYQARWFWLLVCRLLQDRSRVQSVGLEVDDFKGFDDVVLRYKEGYTDRLGQALTAEFYQVKFHVTSAGSLRFMDLCDPKFLRVKSTSFLQRVKAAQERDPTHFATSSFCLVTPWLPHPDDPLAKVHSQQDGRILVDKMNKGKKTSIYGRLREQLKSHLSIESDEELLFLLSRVRLISSPTLEKLGEDLTVRLTALGYHIPEEGRLVFPYDDLARKMVQNTRCEFTADSLRDLLETEGLTISPRSSGVQNYRSLGIRSFLPYTHDLVDVTDDISCLSDCFNGRFIKSNDLWSGTIRPQVEGFLGQHISRSFSYRLHLDTHLSIAFLAGYCIPEKVGVSIEIVQHSAGGLSYWSSSGNNNEDHSKLEITTISSNPIRGEEVALAISLTHQIEKDVTTFVASSEIPVKDIFTATPSRGAAHNSVKDGDEACFFVQQIIDFLRSQDVGRLPSRRIHIFVAGPNGFTFYLGRKMQMLPYWTIYEHDFEATSGQVYFASISNTP